MTTEIEPLLEQLYARAKAGQWIKVMASLVGEPEIAAACSRYRSPAAAWTFLHQAAHFGQEDVARSLIRLGASTTFASLEGETAADVASKRGHQVLSRSLRQASRSATGLWEVTPDPTCLPSSCAWSEATERRARREMRVGYGGGIVTIAADSRYFADSFERALIGWHGSYDPPCGMGGDPMV